MRVDGPVQWPDGPVQPAQFSRSGRHKAGEKCVSQTETRFLIALSQSFSYRCRETQGYAWMAPFSGPVQPVAPFSLARDTRGWPRSAARSAGPVQPGIRVDGPIQRAPFSEDASTGPEPDHACAHGHHYSK